MNMWNKKVDDIIELSKENTQRILGFTVTNIIDILEMHMNEEQREMLEIMRNELMPMYVVSNNNGLNGATSILFEKELRKFADIIEDDFYIIPSSICETIFVPKCGEDNALYIREMVKQVNGECIPADEVLSDNVYLYDRALGKIVIAN